MSSNYTATYETQLFYEISQYYLPNADHRLMAGQASDQPVEEEEAGRAELRPL